MRVGLLLCVRSHCGQEPGRIALSLAATWRCMCAAHLRLGIERDCPDIAALLAQVEAAEGERGSVVVVSKVDDEEKER